ncbi:nuclear protein DGCR14 [Boeremia exigua]|uniref:nuclear protein DGCR14 n=1 Tax=Boeremia exigua TaxID=749465 RepID=UPI001E8DAAFD|nr:nuclear protein DGCR14 [Boeremia exigua]KAH6642636.1 nuclear protein DGCR14 [Boeremia exigua]
MASSNSTALTKRSAAGALMPPPPAPKRIKRPSVVLDEDTYVSAVSHIIRRDFFPGLAESDAQREYLNALESKDKAWIRESGKKLTHAMTPVPYGQRRAADRTRFSRPGPSSTDKTPSVWGADTPITVAGTDVDEDDEEGLGKLNKVDLDMSLNAFQAKYTSEDQESFSAIVDKQNQKKFEKNPWLHDGNRYASKQRIAQQKVLTANAASDSTALTVRPSQNLDDRPAAPTMHKHTAFNTLMFAPDSIESWAPTNIARAETASLAPPKQTRYANTRLPAEAELPPRPTSPTLSAIRDAVSGKPRLGASEGGYTGSETPRVNGYAFVDAQAPDSDSDEDAPEDLLERFGVTGDGAGKATPFSMSEASEREKMHHKMVDRIGAKRSAGASTRPGPTGKGLGIFTSETPRFLSAPTPATRLVAQTPGRKNKGDLTPAAQRLFDRMGKTPRAGGSGFGGSNGRAQDWTPVSRARKKP